MTPHLVSPWLSTCSGRREFSDGAARQVLRVLHRHEGLAWNWRIVFEADRDPVAAELALYPGVDFADLLLDRVNLPLKQDVFSPSLMQSVSLVFYETLAVARIRIEMVANAAIQFGAAKRADFEQRIAEFLRKIAKALNLPRRPPFTFVFRDVGIHDLVLQLQAGHALHRCAHRQFIYILCHVVLAVFGACRQRLVGVCVNRISMVRTIPSNLFYYNDADAHQLEWNFPELVFFTFPLFVQAQDVEQSTYLFRDPCQSS